MGLFGRDDDVGSEPDGAFGTKFTVFGLEWALEAVEESGSACMRTLHQDADGMQLEIEPGESGRGIGQLHATSELAIRRR